MTAILRRRGEVRGAPRWGGSTYWLIPPGIAVGLAGVRAGFDVADVRHWLPDLLTGWVLIACGLIGSALRPECRSGQLMTATGFCWFIGNFSGVDGPVGWIAAATAFTFRGTLAHLVITYPLGRITSTFERSTVAIGYAVALLTALRPSEPVTIGFVALLIASSFVRFRSAPGRLRHARLLALQAVIGLSIVATGGSVARIATPSGALNSAALIGFEVALCAVAITLLGGLLVASWERSEVTDLVVELGDRGRGLDDALAWALGDPSVRVFFTSPTGGDDIDAVGRPHPPPKPDWHQVATKIERDGHLIATVLHDPAAMKDPALVAAVSSAVSLAAAHLYLTEEIQTQITEVEASRRRVIQAAEDEGRRLEGQLHDGARRRLVELSIALERTSRIATDAAMRSGLQELQTDVLRTVEDLDQLSQGLYPRILAERGLADALLALAKQTTLKVDIDVPTEALPVKAAGTAYFVCAESLTNVAKHARAQHVSIVVEQQDDVVQVEITDDGIGGAALAAGSGLRGLAERVDAVGGRLFVAGGVGRGTVVSALIPLQ